MVELWDVLDQERRATGEQVVRPGTGDDGVHRQYSAGDLHLIVAVAVFHGEEMLIQQRTDIKDSWPGRWDLTSAGSVVAGETGRTAIERELAEELGLRLDFRHSRPAMEIAGEHTFTEYYVVDMPTRIDATRLRLQPSEVQAARWASLGEVRSMVENETFVRYQPGFVDLLFALRRHIGPTAPTLATP